MRPWARTKLLEAVAITLLLSSVGRAATGAPQAPRPTPIDFPSLDWSVWSLQHTGLLAKLADRRFAQAPDDPDTAELLLDVSTLARSGRAAEALEVLRRLVAGDAHDVEAAARIVANPGSADARELAASMRARLPEFPREQAAGITRWLIPTENRLAGGRRRGYEALIRQFVDAYAGTEAALLARVDMIGFTRDMNEEVAQLDVFAREHAGTIAGAKALFLEGFQLHVNIAITGVEPRGADPTERFMRVLAIVEDLESGSWPPCEWVDKAPELITQFFASDRAVYAPESVERMLDAYQAFVAKRFTLDNPQPTDNGVGYVITERMASLHELQGDRFGGVEATFDALEQEVANIDAVRTLRADFYIKEARKAGPDARPALVQKAFATLAGLMQTGSETYARKALATRAALHFFESNFEIAAEAYEQYLKEWPESDWAWVAALRYGQAQEAMGDWEAAAKSYRTASLTYPTPAPSAVLANTLAARANETLGRLEEALEHYVNAASSWDDDFGPRYSLYTRHANISMVQETAADIVVTHADLTGRVAALTASMRFPEGVLLEHGRRLVEQGRWQDARISLEALVNGHPTSPLATEARYLAHRARFEHALDIADVEAAASDESTAFSELEALASEPWDPVVGAATLARAAILGKAGLEQQARELTREALQHWLDGQRRYYETGADTPLRGDVAAIRDLLFRPQGGAFYDDDRAMWSARDWPLEMPPFLVVNPDISVKLPDGRAIRVRVSEDLPGLDNVLFLSEEHLRFLYGILNRLGGTKTRPPRAIMEVPNQPIGASVEILALWREFFPARPGHWSGWVAKSSPIIGQIEFQDEGRSRAVAAVRVGNAGCRVVLEKQGSAWVVVRLTDFWIT